MFQGVSSATREEQFFSATVSYLNPSKDDPEEAILQEPKRTVVNPEYISSSIHQVGVPPSALPGSNPLSVPDPLQVHVEYGTGPPSGTSEELVQHNPFHHKRTMIYPSSVTTYNSNLFNLEPNFRYDAEDYHF